MTSQGLHDGLSMRFTSKKAIRQMGFSEEDPRLNPVKVLNPISEEWEVMPTCGLPLLFNSLG